MKKTILLCFWVAFLGSLSIIAKNKTISGKVTSTENGMPISGVNISIKGTEISAVTDANGIYKLSVPANGLITFETPYYKKQEVEVNNRVIIDVQLDLTRKGRKKMK